MKRQTTFNDIAGDGVVVRSYSAQLGFATMGRSPIYIDCPFCELTTDAYLWSLYGSGKRCSTDQCGAIFGGRGSAYNLKENIGETT